MKQQGLTEEVLDEGIDDYEHSDRFDEKDRAILRFVDAIGFRPFEVSQADYEELGQHLSDDEIVELLIYLVNNQAMHVFFSTIDFYPMFDPDGNPISQERAREIYGGELRVPASP